ncbi:MAG: putative sulfate exporter family transporter, partial [Deltaproteobacteria bacterium]|nr:putative sulfate exporter family transporter [Deltaproteobacteria bacterium]
MGARAYVSQTFPSAGVVIGQGKVTVTAERSRLIVIPLLVTLFAIMLLTSIGVWSMGQNVGRYALAFGAIFILAVISFTIANHSVTKTYGLSYAAWALAIGLLISNTIGTPEWLKRGVRTEMYIKTGLVLLGAEILFGKILSIGVPGLMVAWLVTPTVIVFMWFFGTRILKMASKSLVIIIAAATSVCGVSAAIAVAAAARAKKEELTLGVGMTLIFTVLMMIFMPMFIRAIDIGEVLGGAWMGGTIDSTGAVVAAGA